MYLPQYTTTLLDAAELKPASAPGTARIKPQRAAPPRGVESIVMSVKEGLVLRRDKNRGKW
jgi:hypothetical protein